MEILILTIYILTINLFSFFIMWYDKKMAINHNSRISENFIFTLCVFLGSIGIYIGMYKFRHKTKHTKFTTLVPILFILNILSVIYILKYGLDYIGLLYK